MRPSRPGRTRRWSKAEPGAGGAAPRWRWRGLGGRLLLLAAAACVGLLLAEAAVRLLRPQAVWSYSPGLFVIDDSGALALRPGYRGRSSNRTEFDTRVRINASGLRGPEQAPRTDGSRRLLCLGDSFAFGVGVEDDETYAALLAAELAARGLEVESLNGGLPAVGPVEEIAWLESQGLDLEPDLVLLGLFAGNDLLDAALGLEGWEVADGRLVASGTTRGLKAWLYFNSHLVALLKRSVPTSAQRRLRALLGLGEPPSAERQRLSLTFYARQPGELVQRGEERTAAALDRLSVLAERHRFAVAAVLIPDLAALDAGLWQRGLGQLEADPAAYDRRAPTERLQRLLAEREIPTLDLEADVRRALAAGERLYFDADRHWTPAGHRLAAGRLADFLADGAVGARLSRQPAAGGP